MTKDEIYQTIRTTLIENFEIEPERVSLDATLIEDLGLDSIDAIDMAVRIQQLTKVRVDEEQLKTLRTVKDTVDLVAGLLAQAS